MKHYFFCGVGGSGMSPLALFLIRQGHKVSGSDRSHDQGLHAEKFLELAKQGVHLMPQDGTGVTTDIQTLVISSAVEIDIPDIAKALALQIPIIKRAELLAALFNQTKIGIAVGGTSGKSTVTGMIATILYEMKLDPSFVNGGVVRNFESGFRIGRGDIFITETDESDGSIALFNPAIAVLNNIALDHKSMEELYFLFGDFVNRAGQAVLNLDNENVRILPHGNTRSFTYAIEKKEADLTAHDVQLFADHSLFKIAENIDVRLNVPGQHNISNALAALSVAKLMNLDLKKAARALKKFSGIKRRFEIAGTRHGVTVIDDFGHNPDKIRATLQILKQFPGRLIVIFQPHGFGPLKLMGQDIAQVFAEYLKEGDMLLMPEAFYGGGTADRSVTARHVIEWAAAQKLEAHYFETRDGILPFVAAQARKGDRIVVMGARDDSLSKFAAQILQAV